MYPYMPWKDLGNLEEGGKHFCCTGLDVDGGDSLCEVRLCASWLSTVNILATLYQGCTWDAGLFLAGPTEKSQGS